MTDGLQGTIYKPTPVAYKAQDTQTHTDNSPETSTAQPPSEQPQEHSDNQLSGNTEPHDTLVEELEWNTEHSDTREYLDSIEQFQDANRSRDHYSNRIREIMRESEHHIYCARRRLNRAFLRLSNDHVHEALAMSGLGDSTLRPPSAGQRPQTTPAASRIPWIEPFGPARGRPAGNRFKRDKTASLSPIAKTPQRAKRGRPVRRTLRFTDQTDHFVGNKENGHPNKPMK